MIYTRFGTPVNLTSVEVVREADRRGGEFDQYYVTAVQSAPHPQAKSERDNEVGRPILDGQQFPAYELKADEGWGEILDTMKSLNERVCNA